MTKLQRGDLSDAQWEKLKPLLPSQKPHTGKPAHDHRQIINGILWIKRTGAPWDDLPARYDKRGKVSSRFYRWCNKGCGSAFWNTSNSKPNYYSSF